METMIRRVEVVNNALEGYDNQGYPFSYRADMLVNEATKKIRWLHKHSATFSQLDEDVMIDKFGNHLAEFVLNLALRSEVKLSPAYFGLDEDDAFGFDVRGKHLVCTNLMGKGKVEYYTVPIPASEAYESLEKQFGKENLLCPCIYGYTVVLASDNGIIKVFFFTK